MKTKLLKISGLFFTIQLLLCIFISINAQESKDGGSSKFEIKQVEAVKALVINAETTMQEIGPTMGNIYSQLFSYVESDSIQLAGPPFTVYLSWDPEGTVVFESGLPVAKADAGKDDIVFKEYPAMKVVSTLYKGSYEKMEAVYNEMMEYMKTNNLESTNSSWEIYLTDPNEVAPEDNQTIIYFPIK